MSKSAIEAILFDCDGVLVESESITLSVLAEMAAELQAAYPADFDFDQLYGVEMPLVLRGLAEKIEGGLPEGFEADLRQRVFQRFQTELKPIPGIIDLLGRLSLPYCVVSNGPRSKMEVSLSVTGLMPYFTGRIISAYDDGCFKPDPKIYLRAAQHLQVDPHKCAVVEDSLPGVEAGLAAGMRVYAFVKKSEASLFSAKGAIPVHGMSELSELLITNSTD